MKEKREENLIDAPTGNGTELNGRTDIGDRDECNLNDPRTPRKKRKKALPSSSSSHFLSKLEQKKVKKDT
jgi:hypothetical protein